jgi:hypothetical protein
LFGKLIVDTESNAVDSKSRDEHSADVEGEVEQQSVSVDKS